MEHSRSSCPEEEERLKVWLRLKWPQSGWTVTKAWREAKSSLGPVRRQSVIKAGIAIGKTWPNDETGEDLAPLVDVKDQESKMLQTGVGKRTSLKELGNADRHKFFATVGRFGKKTGFKGNGTRPTICLTNIIYNGKVVTDHQWFTCGEGFAGLKSGDKISFYARVTSYVKGYQGRYDIDDHPVRYDWKLERPTQIMIEARPAAPSE